MSDYRNKALNQIVKAKDLLLFSIKNIDFGDQILVKKKRKIYFTSNDNSIKRKKIDKIGCVNDCNVKKILVYPKDTNFDPMNVDYITDIHDLFLIEFIVNKNKQLLW